MLQAFEVGLLLKVRKEGNVLCLILLTLRLRMPRYIPRACNRNIFESLHKMESISDSVQFYAARDSSVS
jgi:hypothetical protein